MSEAPISQHDTNKIPATRGILVIVGGLVKVGFPGGTKTATFSNLPVGWHPMRIDMLYTATDDTVEIHGAY